MAGESSSGAADRGPRPTARFAALMRTEESDVRVEEVALLIAAHADPRLDVEAQLGRVDALAEGCRGSGLEGMRHQLFEVLGFGGAREDYYDPRNSMLDRVLDLRRGIPITLSVVVMAVGSRVGERFDGVGMPGHFLTWHQRSKLWLDAFDGGRLLDVDGCERLFRRVNGDDTPFDQSYLNAVGPFSIATRMLANLKQIFMGRGDLEGLAWALRLRSLIPGVPRTELAELARVQAGIGSFSEAASSLEELAGGVGEELAERVRAQARSLRARLN